MISLFLLLSLLKLLLFSLLFIISDDAFKIVKLSLKSIFNPLFDAILLTILSAHFDENHICDSCSSSNKFCDINNPDVFKASRTPALSYADPGSMIP